MARKTHTNKSLAEVRRGVGAPKKGWWARCSQQFRGYSESYFNGILRMRGLAGLWFDGRLK